MLHLVVAEAVIKRHDYRTSEKHSKISNGPLRAVLARNSDLIAFLHPIRKKRIRNFFNLLLCFPVCELLFLGRESMKEKIIRITLA